MLPFALSRLGVLVVGLLAAIVIGYDPPPTDEAVWRIAADPFHSLLARWDTYWYLDVVTRGYHWNGNPLDQQNVVFFPLYPLLMRIVGGAVGGHPLLAGLAISLAAFLIALAYLWRWIAEDFGVEVATGAVLLVCAFPFSVFFSAVYTESLFLLTAVAACYHARRHELLAAAIFGLFAGLVRPNGVLLAIPLGSMIFVNSRDVGRPYTRLAAVIAPVAGVLIFSAYLKAAVGDGFAWITGQAAWPTIAPWVAQPTQPSPIRLRDVIIQAGNGASLLFALAGVLPVSRILGAGYGLFVAASVIPGAARHGLQSLGRFTSVTFPLFVWLAAAVPGRSRQWILVMFAIGQMIAAALFFSWRPLV